VPVTLVGTGADREHVLGARRDARGSLLVRAMGLALETAASADGSYDTRGVVMSVFVSVAVGGAVGAMSRYGVDRLIEQRVESSFPWSTFVINVSGCVVVGFLIAALVDLHSAPEWLRAGLVVGFCGGYTTFSTFAQETLDLLEANDIAMAVASVTANVVIGVLAVLAGARLGRLA
jgi:CrcB protein